MPQGGQSPSLVKGLMYYEDPADRKVEHTILVTSLGEYQKRTGEIVTNRTQWSGDDPGVPLEPVDRLAAVVVDPDDEYGALVVVVDTASGLPAWENPANGDDATVRYVAAAVLLADTMRTRHG